MVVMGGLGRRRRPSWGGDFPLVLYNSVSRSTHLILVTFSFDRPVMAMSGNSRRPPRMAFWKLNTRFLNCKGSNEAKSKSLDPKNQGKQICDNYI